MDMSVVINGLDGVTDIVQMRSRSGATKMTTLYVKVPHIHSVR